jgi:hypothetical protein
MMPPNLICLFAMFGDLVVGARIRLDLTLVYSTQLCGQFECPIMKYVFSKEITIVE